jgi:ParB family chromosome partitioning protein
VDRFAARSLAKSLAERAGFASRLLEIDAQVKRIVKGLEGRGFRSPYLRNYVVARINPVRFHKAAKGDAGPPMAMGAALTRMAAAARRFDLASVRGSELALVAAVAGE